MVTVDSDASASPDWGRLEAKIASFESAWKRGERPSIADYLVNDDPDRHDLLIELVHTEFEYRLKLGESARVEDYLRTYPSLSRSRQTILDLVRAEWSFRKRREANLSLGPFLERFPDFHDDMTPPQTDVVPESSATIPLPGLSGPNLPAPTDLPLPRRFGKFELRQKIGQGSFGVVYRGWDTVLNREVAIKIPRPEAIEAYQNVRAFLREARNARDLRHPNIVAIHDAGPIEGIVCIVRAYVEGTTLEEQLRIAPIASEEAAALMTLVVEALDHAHRQGVIHRDLKPSNILLDRQGQPHISDFGLAKRASGDSTISPKRRLGTIIGTPAYMSPEQARGSPHEVDARSDVFSAGVVLYELLTGSLPFRGRGRLLLAQIQELDPTPPRALNEEVTPDLQAICLKALARDPDDRYQSAQAMADDLRTYLGGRAIPPQPEHRSPKSRPRRQSQPLFLVILAGLLTLLMAEAFLWHRAEKRRGEDAILADRSYRALLDLARLAEIPGPEEAQRQRPMVARLWSEAEELAPLLESDPALLGLAAESRRRLALRARSKGSDRLAEGHWVKAVELGERLSSLDPDSPEHREGLALALANLAEILARSGKSADSRRLFERALGLRREVVEVRRLAYHQARPLDALRSIELGEALLRVAEIERPLGKLADLSEVEAIFLDLEVAREREAPLLARLARISLELAGFQLDGRMPMKSIGSADRAYRLYQQLPAGPIAEAGLAGSSLALARANRERDKPVESWKAYHQAIRRLDLLVRADPESPELRRKLGIAEFELGRLLSRTGPKADAIAAFRRSLTIHEGLASDEPSGYLNRLELAEVREALALEPEGTPIRSAWLEVLAASDRLRVWKLAPGLESNRRELLRIASTVLWSMTDDRWWDIGHRP